MLGDDHQGVSRQKEDLQQAELVPLQGHWQPGNLNSSDRLWIIIFGFILLDFNQAAPALRSRLILVRLSSWTHFVTVRVM